MFEILREIFLVSGGISAVILLISCLIPLHGKNHKTVIIATVGSLCWTLLVAIVRFGLSGIGIVFFGLMLWWLLSIFFRVFICADGSGDFDF
jgi:hypothetical protein